MRQILVIRFGSLGDLCLLGWSLAAAADAAAAQERRVTLVTKAAFAPLMAGVRGVDEVIALPASGMAGLWRLARRLRTVRWDTVLDAHDILRGHALQLLMGRQADRRIRKDTTGRLALLRGIRTAGLDGRTMRHRFDEVLSDLRDEGQPGPVAPPLGHLRPTAEPAAALGLAPGAQWDTKRWPQRKFAALLERFRQDSGAPVRIFLGPREEAWFAGSDLASVCDTLPDVQIIRGRSLPDVAGLLAGCRALVTNDSGLLHLAEAAGTPVLAVFGPTVRQFGYFPCLPESQALETELDCRPCSRNGKRPCHRGDLACLQRIDPEAAHPFLQRMFPA